MANEAVAEKQKPRVFVYEGHEYEDPGQHLSNEDVLGILARTFGALAGGIVDTDEQEDRIVVHLKPRPEHKAGAVVAFSRERSCMSCDGPLCALCDGCFEEGECNCYENVIDDAMLVEWAEANKEHMQKFAELCRQRPGVDALEIFFRAFDLQAATE